MASCILSVAILIQVQAMRLLLNYLFQPICSRLISFKQGMIILNCSYVKYFMDFNKIPKGFRAGNQAHKLHSIGPPQI